MTVRAGQIRAPGASAGQVLTVQSGGSVAAETPSDAKPTTTSWGVNRQELSGNVTLTDSGDTLQVLDPVLVGRDVTLPPLADTNPVFFIANVSQYSSPLTLKDNGGGTLTTIDPGEVVMAYSTGLGGAWVVLTPFATESSPVGGLAGPYQFMQLTTPSSTTTPANYRFALDASLVRDVMIHVPTTLLGFAYPDLGSVAPVFGVYKNGALDTSETIPSDSGPAVITWSVPPTGVLGDNFFYRYEQLNGLGGTRFFTYFHSVDSDSDGGMLSFMWGSNDINTDEYAGVQSQSVDNFTPSYSHQLTIPRGGNLATFCADHPETGIGLPGDYDIHVNGALDQSVLVDQNEDSTLTSSAVSAGDELMLRWRGGGQNGMAYYSIGITGSGARAVVSFGGSDDGVSPKVYEPWYRPEFGLANTVDESAEVFIADSHTLDSMSYRTQQTDNAAYEILKNGATDQTPSKGASDDSGVISLSGTEYVQGDTIALRLSSTTPQDSNLHIAFVDTP